MPLIPCSQTWRTKEFQSMPAGTWRGDRQPFSQCIRSEYFGWSRVVWMTRPSKPPSPIRRLLPPPMTKISRLR